MLDNFSVIAAENQTYDETWAHVWGETKEVKNNYNMLTIQLQENTPLKRLMNVIFKVYNDGIGFRYEFPEQENLDDIVIMDEHSQFNLTADHTCWWIPGDWEIYEHLWTKSKLSEIDASAKRNSNFLAQTYIPDEYAVNTPLTMKTDEGLYLSFHEANLTDYSGMTLHIDRENLILSSALVAYPDGSKVITKTPFITPWRTIQVAESAGDLIESNLIVNLNEPNKLNDTEWINPAKYVGIWWEMHLGKSTWNKEGGKHGATTENAKRYIDFAAENNIQAVLIEGWNTGWEDWIGENREGIFDFVTPYSDFDIEEVVNYAKGKGISIIGHHETSAAVSTYEQQLDTAFAFYKHMGINTIKTGYVGMIYPKGQRHHGQWMVNHYRRVLEKAAQNKIMINAHEPIKPTGIRRTYPNMMSREGLRGQEFNAWSDMNPPEHTVIFPFTRMLAGPIDFTPGIFDIKFDEYKDENQVNTTIAKQLALYVVIYSPLQMAADLPENYEGNPSFQFIRDVAVDWDDTKVLNAEIGEYVSIVRKEKNTDNWFLGSITNQEKRDFQIPLNFLNKDKKYQATIYADAPDAHWNDNPTAVVINKQLLTSETIIDIKLAPGGGQAISFVVVDN
jgi:hypothetical protein